MEVTWSEDNGFHPHFHILLFVPSGIDQKLMSNMKADFYQFGKMLVWPKNWVSLSLKHGVSVDGADKAEGYVAKWGLESEMTKSHIKRSKKGYSMFDLLRAYVATEDEKFKRVWMVYASAFKGRKQLVWTNGLRDLFSTGCLGEVTDEEIATEHREDASLFAELTFEQWKAVYQTKSEAYLLKVVEERPLEFDAFIEGLEKLYVLMGKPDRGRKSKTLNKSVNNKNQEISSEIL